MRYFFLGVVMSAPQMPSRRALHTKPVHFAFGYREALSMPPLRLHSPALVPRLCRRWVVDCVRDEVLSHQHRATAVLYKVFFIAHQLLTFQSCRYFWQDWQRVACLEPQRCFDRVCVLRGRVGDCGGGEGAQERRRSAVKVRCCDLIPYHT